MTGVHPETYPVVEQIMAKTGKPVAELMGRSRHAQNPQARAVCQRKFGVITVKDILAELEKPGRDPRPDFKVARFNDGVEDIKDLQGRHDAGRHGEQRGAVRRLRRPGRAPGRPGAREPAGHKFVNDAREVVKTGDIVKVQGAGGGRGAQAHRPDDEAGLQASCSIPFVLRAVHDIPGAPPGAYWDGGITDYHLHLAYREAAGQGGAGLVLYPHFQQAVVPGWLDKALKWRHGATPFLDTTVVLAPDPAWVERLPNRKLPDRTDFTRYGNDLAARVKAWNAAAGAAQQLADEFGEWVDNRRRVLDKLDHWTGAKSITTIAILFEVHKIENFRSICEVR
jgi:hypothetical protein